jgi:uncharacterized caspase-like protein
MGIHSKLIWFLGLTMLNLYLFGQKIRGIKVESTGKTYSISIGIDEYNSFPLYNCKKDAIAIHKILKAQAPGDSNKHYLLLDAAASKDSILQVLKRIANMASTNDRFVFFYAGFSLFTGKISNQMETFFCPYASIDELNRKQLNGDSILHALAFDKLISMKLLQEYVQLIPCRNQMFIAEAASTENLNAEFASALMQGSPDIAALQDINRIIVAPKQIGQELRDGGMLALAIQKLDTAKYKLTDLFQKEKSASVAQAIINNCKPDYASVFFEKDFIKLYQQINRQNPVTRSRNLKLNLPDPAKQALANKKKYALLIGIEHYKVKGWDPLNNPIKDATEIGSVLKDLYGFDTVLLKDPTAETIYNNLLELYSIMGPDDDFILYVAGHGDYDQALLDDGFLVCIDSKPVEKDLMRNSYIAHSKLKRILNKLPAKNVLVLLDICHAGTFDEKVLGGQTREGSTDQVILKRNINQFFLEKSMYSTRKVLTSVGKQPAFDGDAGKHSPFATYLLKLLYGAGGDVGMLTASDIFSSLQKAGLNEDTNLRIYPHQAAFGKHDPEGEFILLPVVNEK